MKLNSICLINNYQIYLYNIIILIIGNANYYPNLNLLYILKNLLQVQLIMIIDLAQKTY